MSSRCSACHRQQDAAAENPCTCIHLAPQTADWYRVTRSNGRRITVPTLEAGLACQWVGAPYGTPTTTARLASVEQRIAELAPDGWSPRDHADGQANHAAGGPTEYATYVDRAKRNRYNGRVGDAVASPAPETVIHTGIRPALRPYQVPRDWVGPKDLQSRCYAAARLTLTGKGWSPEDVSECAADVMLRTLERHPLKHGYVAPKAAQMARLVHHAADWRKGTERDRTRDQKDTATRATLAGQAHVTEETSATVGTPLAAARRAIDALQNLGLDRRVWPLAYTSARLADGADGSSIAAELNMTPTAYRQAVSRARKYVPSAVATKDNPPPYSYTDHLGAVAADCEAFPLDPKSVAENMGQEPDWPARSMKRYKGAPTTCTRDATIKRDGRRNYARPTWTEGLAPNTARRLATAAAMKRARELARTPEETTRRRLAVGLPATVR